MSLDVDKLQRFLNEPGSTIGRYEVVREIGRGGSAVVYEAVDPALERRVAIKVLTDGSTERLRQEAAAAARLRHAHIVAIHEIGADHIVMDHVDGPTLAEALPTLPLAERLRVLEVIARAVHHAHEHGVIHRDLKPANIILRPDGEPMLTDFGLAKLSDGRHLTLPGTGLGTPAYMAPEQGRGDAGRAADVWSLGVMLYEMVANRLPFTGDSPLQIFERVLRDTPASLPGALGAVAAKALQKSPGARYASAAAFAEDLSRAREGRRVQASRAGMFLRRHGLVIGGVAVAGAAGLALWPSQPPALPLDEAQGLRRWRGDEQALTRKLERDPNDLELLIYRSRVRRFRAEYEEGRGRNPEPNYAAAERDVLTALGAHPESREAHLQLGIISLTRARYRRENGIDPSADLDRAERSLAQAEGVKATRTYRGVLALERALWARYHGGNAEALLQAAEATLSPPEYGRAFMFRGRVRAELGRFDEAESDFAEYFRQQPVPLQEEAYKAALWRGQARLQAGDLEGAERHLSQAVAFNRDSAALLVHRAEVRARLGRQAQAAADLEKAIAINPTLEIVAGDLARSVRKHKP